MYVKADDPAHFFLSTLTVIISFFVIHPNLAKGAIYGSSQ